MRETGKWREIYDITIKNVHAREFVTHTVDSPADIKISFQLLYTACPQIIYAKKTRKKLPLEKSPIYYIFTVKAKYFSFSALSVHSAFSSGSGEMIPSSIFLISPPFSCSFFSVSFVSPFSLFVPLVVTFSVPFTPFSGGG